MVAYQGRWAIRWVSSKFQGYSWFYYNRFERIRSFARTWFFSDIYYESATVSWDFFQRNTVEFEAYFKVTVSSEMVTAHIMFGRFFEDWVPSAENIASSKNVDYNRTQYIGIRPQCNLSESRRNWIQSRWVCSCITNRWAIHKCKTAEEFRSKIRLTSSSGKF